MTASKNLETVSGLVERIDQKGTGIKLVDSPEWLNISQYHPLGELPKLGQRVNLQVERTDRGAWIQTLEVLDQGQIHQLPIQPRRGAGRSLAELREIRRLACLKAAAAFCATRPDVKSAEVVQLAERWVQWVEQPDGTAPTEGR